MRKLATQNLFVFGSAVVLVAGLAALFAFGQTAKWVGHTDLEIRFNVTDAATGLPIRNATIHIRSELGGFCEKSAQQEFTMTTDENGDARQIVKNCMCFGSEGTFEDTFASNLPPWRYHATAAGCAKTGTAFLETSENSRQVQRGRPFATLSVPIRLRKVVE